MPDQRITKLAKVLTNYSLNLQAGEQMLLSSTHLAHELTLAVYREAILAGAHVTIQQKVPGTREVFLKYASDAQLEYLSPIRKLIYETFDVELSIIADLVDHAALDLGPRENGMDGIGKTRQPVD